MSKRRPRQLALRALRQSAGLSLLILCSPAHSSTQACREPAMLQFYPKCRAARSDSPRGSSFTMMGYTRAPVTCLVSSDHG